MRRWMTRILICLILGAITTVAVAWACAAWAPVAPIVNTYPVFHGTYIIGPAVDDEPGSDLFMAAVQYETIGRSRLVWVHGAGNHRAGMITRSPSGGLVIGLDGRAERVNANPVWWSRVQPPDMSDNENVPPRMTSFILEDATGWPFRALTSQAIAQRWRQWDRTSSSDGIVLKSESTPTSGWANDNTRMLPLRPIAFGFLADVIIFAAFWFALFLLRPEVRRYNRRLRGQCIMCGYDLRGDLAAGCPECGWNRDHGDSQGGDTNPA